MTRFVPRILLGLLLASTVGCGGGTATTVIDDVATMIAPTAEGDYAALLAEGEAAWAERSSKESTLLAIAKWEEAARVPTPEGTNRRAALTELHTRLARGYYWLGHAHISYEADSEEALLAAYQTGMDRAMTALQLGNEQWRLAMLYETPIPDAVEVLGDGDVPAAYWYATCLGRYGIVKGIATVLSKVNDIFSVMTKVEATNPDFFYGATNRYFGVYYTKLPFGNPDVDQARRRLEENIAEYPMYLETRVLLAYDWATVTQDREIAERELNAVLAADISPWPELAPENTNAKRRATKILEELDEYFR